MIDIDARTSVAKILLRWHYGDGVDVEAEWRRRSERGREFWMLRADEILAAATSDDAALFELPDGATVPGEPEPQQQVQVANGAAAVGGQRAGDPKVSPDAARYVPGESP